MFVSVGVCCSMLFDICRCWSIVVNVCRSWSILVDVGRCWSVQIDAGRFWSRFVDVLDVAQCYSAFENKLFIFLGSGKVDCDQIILIETSFLIAKGRGKFYLSSADFDWENFVIAKYVSDSEKTFSIATKFSLPESFQITGIPGTGNKS